MISLDLIPNTPIFTIQDLYDRQVAWFSQPDARLAYTSADGGSGQCVYHGISDDGNDIACAIGCSLPVRLYNRAMEDRAFYSSNGDKAVQMQALAVAYKEELEGFYPLDDNLFLMYAKRSQQLHDDLASQGQTAEHFLARLADLAVEYDVRTA